MGDAIARLEAFCPACDFTHGFNVDLEAHDKWPEDSPVWTFDGNWERPTFWASMLANKDRVIEHHPICHSFLKNGQWEYLTDSTHTLAGQTVPVPPPDPDMSFQRRPWLASVPVDRRRRDAVEGRQGLIVRYADLLDDSGFSDGAVASRSNPQVGDFYWDLRRGERNLVVALPGPSGRALWVPWPIAPATTHDGSSWNWNGDADLPTLTPSLNWVGVWQWLDDRRKTGGGMMYDGPAWFWLILFGVPVALVLGNWRSCGIRAGALGILMYVDNFKQYWREHLCHVGIGFSAGYLAMRGLPWGAFLIGLFVCTRQTLEYLKRKDTPGIDLAYYLAGVLLGIVAGAG